jgi:hypothetical protein
MENRTCVGPVGIWVAAKGAFVNEPMAVPVEVVTVASPLASNWPPWFVILVILYGRQSSGSCASKIQCLVGNGNEPGLCRCRGRNSNDRQSTEDSSENDTTYSHEKVLLKLGLLKR